MKRRVLYPLVCLVALSVLNGCWFQPGAGPHRSGHNPGESRLTSANVGSLTQVWSTQVGDEAVLDPVISRYGVHAVSGQNVALQRLIDGGRQWSAPVPDTYPGLLVGPPSLANGEVLVPGYVSTHSEAGGVYAFDPASGAGQAQVAPASNFSVTVSGNTMAGTTLGQLGNGMVVTGLRVTDLVTAETKSAIMTLGPTPTPTSVAISAHMIFLSVGTQIRAFTPSGPKCSFVSSTICSPDWTSVLGGVATVPVLSDDESTVFVGDSSGAVTALNAADGTVMWRAALPGGGSPGVVATPTVGAGWLYATSSDGRMHAFESDGCGSPTCPPVWSASTGSPVDKQAALAGGVIYVASQDGTIKAFDAAGCGSPLCTPVWEGSTGSRITGGPAVAHGSLLVGTQDGRLIAYRPS